MNFQAALQTSPTLGTCFLLAALLPRVSQGPAKMMLASLARLSQSKISELKKFKATNGGIQKDHSEALRVC